MKNRKFSLKDAISGYKVSCKGKEVTKITILNTGHKYKELLINCMDNDFYLTSIDGCINSIGSDRFDSFYYDEQILSVIENSGFNDNWIAPIIFGSNNKKMTFNDIKSLKVELEIKENSENKSYDLYCSYLSKILAI